MNKNWKTYLNNLQNKIMKKIHTLFFILSVLSMSVKAQIPNFSWATQAGSTLDDYANSVYTDISGNVYTTGTFQGTVDFDPSAATFNMTALGSWDIFVTKLDANGNLVWAKQLGGTQIDRGRSIAVDGFNNVYITGSFFATADFDPGAGTFNMNSIGGNDIFICKLDASGNFVWAKQMGSVFDDEGLSLTVNSTGVVYTTGDYNSTVDFDPGAGTYTLASNGSTDVFVSKLDANGNFLFAKSVGGTGADVGYAIKTDGGGNIVYAGYFTGTVDMDPGNGSYTLAVFGGGSYDAFVNKLDGAGNFSWSKQLGGTGYDASYAIATDFFNAIYITGTFVGTADFDPGAGTYTLTANGPGDVFICKLDVSGNFVWTKSFGGGGGDIGSGISVNNSGVYTTGSFGFTTDFDPGPGTFTITSNGVYDAFVSKLDAAGNFLFAAAIGGTGDDAGNSISADPSNNIYLCGKFENTVDFNPTAVTSSLTSNGVADAFVTKWGQCIKPNAPTITTAPANLNVCVTGSTTINATSTGSITWYTSPTGTTSVGTGGSYTTPILTVTTTYYVEALTCAPSASRTIVTVTVSPQPTINVTITNSVICLGGYSKFIAGGALTYTWTGGISNGTNFTPTVTTMYTVTATSAMGCTNTAIAGVTVNPTPTITVVSTSSLLCIGESATLTAGGLPSYGWNTGDITSTIVISPTVTTVYNVSGNGTNGCFASFNFTQTVSPCIGIKEFSTSSEELLVYPNPTNGNFTITSKENMEFTIINELGQLVKIVSLTEANDHRIFVTDLPNGIYTLMNKTLQAKIVVIAP